MAMVSGSWLKNSPGRESGAEACRPSLGAVLILRRTQGRSSAQSGPESLAISDAFRFLWNLSTNPLGCGWYAVVWWSLSPQELHHLSPQDRRELRPSVASNVCRHFEAGDLLVDQSPGARLRGGFLNRDSLRPPYGPIHHHEEVTSLLGHQQGPDDINMDVLESANRQVEVLDGGSCVSLDLGGLAPGTVPGQFHHLLLHPLPHKLLHNHPHGCLYCWVSEVVDQTEDLRPPVRQDHWVQRAC
ncbi:uncharacterized protein [Narcine bancroftii]|uniref:uncharacterized protein n=1 Tax=Narcine bancroftii TaxID=1343680 RepID=UPI0038312129